ncbi:ribosome small subunit-dependent GTPase A [Zophobihabitans entericus]|uniref:Small ribosomal subunit biogenesis GTPase RsgA n=1 Tax=Zophobihabitans entericus TaxID=1635327 RepID=A0A6G9ICH1_9GAMM|nr:ribosome small subunit-dependent GTPase A [Zophobihabitans entericus]QIQ21404.1 ribosome small subunit-dependent GTPase A [Zophobihabitans entericus]
MLYQNLRTYGLTTRFAQEALLYPELMLARVTEQHRSLYTIMTETGEKHASVSGKFAYLTHDTAAYPAVGDWVMVSELATNGDHIIIQQVLSRKSIFDRKAAGTHQAIQVVATNIDTIFICMSLNADFNLRRLERYLAIAWQSAATPVIVLTKSDLCSDIATKLTEIEAISFGVDVLLTSILNHEVQDIFAPYLSQEKTVVFLGSSGVGKSSIINQLMGKEVLLTREVGSDDSGRHTTTHRAMFVLPTGGVVIDTPGMRELQLDSGNLSKTFEDLEELSSQCKFRNCSHTSERGCAVLAAIADGTLSAGRLENYRKLEKETQYEGLSSRQREHTKITNMFGSMNELKQFKRNVKSKHNY